MSDFHPFATAIKAKFDQMSKCELYTVAISGDELYAAYLAAFPKGSNPIFRERTEHDCSCCKNFIRNIGNVVAIMDGKPVSVWSVFHQEQPYATVAAALAELVEALPITGIFRTSEPKYGAKHTVEALAEGKTRRWNHFHAQVAARHHTKSPDAAKGSYATTVGVFKRGLIELTSEALQTVVDLINNKSLYRGEEHLPALLKFQELHTEYQHAGAPDIFAWTHASSPVAGFRNTVIGTLVTDLSNGVPLEAAVKSFEQKVAPANYKRPTALITPRMVEDAMATINDLGLQPALDRRHTKLSDVSVNNVLWVDGSIQGKMKGGIEGLLMDAATIPVVSTSKSEDISIDDFMVNVLPRAKGIDLLIKNSQQGNFVSITAPVHADTPKLFKWDNDFAWSYAGEVTDAIKERVKAAGGSVVGDLCCRLAWDYRDDLDFHMKEPGGGHIHFGNRRQMSRHGGMLDLDANGLDGTRDDPAENIFYADRRKMADGTYQLVVNNYNRRSDGKGFVVQIEFDGQIHNIVYDGVVKDSQSITVAYIQKKGNEFSITKSLPSSQSMRDIWGVKTESFSKVATVMYSPNYWDDNATGNKHWFFILDGCRNPDAVRGIYNEFLNSSLEKHRKVFEVLGDRTKCQPSDEQLSGVGFSSTKRDSVLVSVTGDKLRKVYNINF